MRKKPPAETSRNEIVVYQPKKTMRLEVNLSHDTVWLTQTRIAELFGVQKAAISKHLKNIFASGELSRRATVSKTETVRFEGGRQIVRSLEMFNLDVIIAVGYRVNSKMATRFRIWATSVLREYMLRGFALNRQNDSLVMEMDRRFASHEKRIAAVEERIDFVVQSALPAPEMVFSEGQFLTAHDAIRKIVKAARKRLVLIDNYIDEGVLTLLAERRKGVACRVYGKNAGKRDIQLAYSRFRQQYPNDGLALVRWAKAHDRFIVCDNTVWLCGASVKDAGRRMFALVKTSLCPDIVLDALP